MKTPTEIDKEYLRVLGKGMITLPKKWREELNMTEGTIIKATKTKDSIVIEFPDKPAPYRMYTSDELESFLIEDRLSLEEKKELDKKFNQMKK
jgi:AbrB family looped-hinge helix DNA binding protein